MPSIYKHKSTLIKVLIAAALFASLSGASILTGQPESYEGLSPRTPSRIVSLAPSVTEILFALGLGERVVGVTNYCDYPEAVRSLPRVGGFKGKSVETIVSLHPDLVVGTRDGNESGELAVLSRLGVATLYVQPSNLAEILQSILAIGQATGKESEALALVSSMEGRIREVGRMVSGHDPVRVLFVYGRDPLVLAGPGTFADDMIALAGGENVAGDALTPYPRFSMETVISCSPEVIVEGAMGSEKRSREAMAFWSRYPSLAAVKDGRVALVDEDLITRPGPRIVDGVELLARILHPESFQETSP